jgi:hypothetical protein
MKSVARLLRVLALVVIAFAPPLHGSPLTGAAVQTWRYNPQAKVTTITLSNLSPKDILAYNLTITSTYEDGSSDKEEVLTDLLDRKINATLVKGTPTKPGSLRDSATVHLRRVQPWIRMWPRPEPRRKCKSS